MKPGDQLVPLRQRHAVQPQHKAGQEAGEHEVALRG